jgi:hypothetical protein
MVAQTELKLHLIFLKAAADLKGGWVGSSPPNDWIYHKNTVAKTSNHR